MNTRRYVVRCTAQGCQDLAEYKIASTWNNGATEELKTYALACASHIEPLFARAHEKSSRCRLAEGESLSPPGIFRIEPGRRDKELVRVPELEAKFA